MTDWPIYGWTCIISDPGFAEKCDAYVSQLEKHGKTPGGIYGFDNDLCIHSTYREQVFIWYADSEINQTQVEEFINKVNDWYEKI